ncbi:gliding motility-associated ABC transporter ATP-binding subunit GldA [Litoribacter alkaliphilus]|uniref:Gliding motility-associated ABC transporter ATP-binding subunit GldA n=1 Tax=Litoribacter ruber TaxID=702568 RepID=A0AAP2CG26_9BACT|nr:gliding motility-associated ABC transporter ATP-binding subunit GldA [Litoribacter alkaliphilus]MBS9523966.1 gliding motility-associated ABC transporter ATP-binding subunit GldA [Litoribacter alkaliphilus]
MSLEVINLSKTYGEQKVLNKISFEAKAGQVLGFLGPNGAGKSTTMKIATGYVLPDEGEVRVNGVSVLSDPKEVSRMIGYLPEHNPLYLDMYVKEFLAFIAGLYSMGKSHHESRAKTVIEQCGLGPEQHKKIGQLSKGYRQRVGLAKALIHDPSVIILDEPTTGLDPNQLVDIRKLIKDISRNKTLILSTHIMQEVEAICEKVVIINKGQIVAQDLLANLKSEAGKSSILLQIEETMDLELFKNLPLVNSHKLVDQHTALFYTSDPKLLRKQLLQFVQDKDLTLVRIQQEEKNLESIFHQLTNQNG